LISFDHAVDGAGDVTVEEFADGHHD
jgi:hypothetical protein